MNLRNKLLMVGAAAAVGIGGYFGYKSDWFQEAICENDISRGGAHITRAEYSCEAFIEANSTVSDVVVSTERGTIVYSDDGLPPIFLGHPDARGEAILRPLARNIQYNLRGIDGPLMVFPMHATYSSGGGFSMDMRILAMDVPDFCEER